MVAALTATGADADHLKCVGLVAAFFAPVLAICFNLGTRYLRSHWRLFAAGWLAPGLWTVAIDCVGAQYGFGGRYSLSGGAHLEAEGVGGFAEGLDVAEEPAAS